MRIQIDAGVFGSAEVAVSGPGADQCDFVDFGSWDADCLHPYVGGYGSEVFTVSGSESCPAFRTNACDGMSLAFSAPDGFFGRDFEVEYADGEVDSVDLGELQPSYTYHLEKPIVCAWAWLCNTSGSDAGFIVATPGACPVSEAMPLVMM